MLIHVYPCLPMLTQVYPCLRMFTHVYFSLPMFTDVCLHLLTIVHLKIYLHLYTCLLGFTNCPSI